MWIGAKKDIFEDAKNQKPTEDEKKNILPYGNLKIIIGIVILIAFALFIILTSA